MSAQYIDEDFVALRRTATGSGKPFLTLSFGDAVEVLPDTQNDHPGFTKVRAITHFDGTAEGFIKGKPPLRDEGYPEAIDGRRSARRRHDFGDAKRKNHLY